MESKKMTIYEYDQAIYSLIDEETGEIMNEEEFDRLNMEREQKIESVLLWIKDLDAEATALKNEEAKLKERRQFVENKKDRLKGFISTVLGGQGFKTARVAASFRKSKSVAFENEEGFIAYAKDFCPQYLRFKEPEINKEILKADLKIGKEINGVHFEEKTSITIQ